ncbi:hypothetical protein GQ457_06G016870 [Hibiscus cannabinus]
MAEQPDLASIQKQMNDIQTHLQKLSDESQPPKWWEAQETRLSILETNVSETRNYFGRILQLMNRSVEEDQPSPLAHKQNDDQVHTTLPAHREGKQPMQVIVIKDKERYSYQPAEPGLLQSKPPSEIPPFQHKMGPEMGSSSDRAIFNEQESLPRAPQLQNTTFGNPGNLLPRVRIELQPFEGDNPRGWLKKCNKYFTLFGIPEENRLDMASMYLMGKVETWFDGYILQKHRVTWAEFQADLCHIFTDKTYTDTVEEFNKLLQKTTVEEYQDRFEELQPYMLLQNPELGEDYFISSFISGLRDDIKHRVKMHEPRTLANASRLAKLTELSLEFEAKRSKYPQRPSYLQFQNSTLKQPTTPITTKNIIPPKQPLLDYRRANNLCFKCGEKFVPGHQCKLKQLNMMEEEKAQSDSEIPADQLQDNAEDPASDLTSPEGNLEISINALIGSIGYNTLRIQGSIKGKPFNILIDSGSTHSFTTSRWAKEGLEVVSTQPLAITVANGEKLYSTARSNQLSWKMQGHTLYHDFQVLQMGGTDMVLGVDWMRKFSPIIMDFKAMTISFDMDGKTVVLQGGQKQPVFKEISANRLQKLAEKEPELMGEIYFLDAEEVDSTIPKELQPLLDAYQDVFAAPTTLPPLRKQDHAITLKPGSQPINLRPYRFTHHQKAEVEKQISEMLSASIIQTNTSPFASPCLLVKKKDGTWRFCVDYRQLNDMTVKNKFPIPIVEDLLDELTGAHYFSKVDLRSGYWQIKVKTEDISKTAFRTHHGHFEFKVMPFGLTNAPATFQSLMNALFAPYLRKFVLVFFDDILIYSPNLQAHKQHLQTVLEVLREHKLFAKRNKCFFGQQQVEYLGHVISSTGVATDPSKIEAMANWPLPKSLKALRGFLGLTSYYRKFIRGYAEISKPLTSMLKKDNFKWTIEAKSAFEALKQAMCTAPMSPFDKTQVGMEGEDHPSKHE